MTQKAFQDFLTHEDYVCKNKLLYWQNMSKAISRDLQLETQGKEGVLLVPGSQKAGKNIPPTPATRKS